MLPSGNDAAYALAEAFGAFLEPSCVNPVHAFLRRMNKKAAEMGLSGTHYANPHGLTNSKNVSTAKDVANLSRIAMMSFEFRQIVKTKHYSCEITSADNALRRVIWKNTNKLLSQGYDGVKTGRTYAAGGCLSVRVRQGDTQLIIVVLGCRTNEARFSDVARLTVWMFSRLA